MFTFIVHLWQKIIFVRYLKHKRKVYQLDQLKEIVQRIDQLDQWETIQELINQIKRRSLTKQITHNLQIQSLDVQNLSESIKITWDR